MSNSKKPGKIVSIYFLTAATAISLNSETGINKDLANALQKEAQPKQVLEHFERDYILLKEGTLEFENNFQFTYNSSDQIFLDSFAILNPVFLTLGQFGIETKKRHIISDTLTFRYGLRDYLQTELSIPLLYRHEVWSKTEANEEDTFDKAGIGDIALGLSAQVLKETDTKPAVITNLSLKSTTGKSPFQIDIKDELALGSGYYSIKAGANLVKTLDPTAIFGGVSYTYNFDKSTKQVIDSKVLEKVEPGDSIGINMGLAYAVSYDFSLNFQFLYDYTMPAYSTVDGNRSKLANSTISSAQFKIGTGWALDKDTSVNISLGIGLTSDSPDFVLEFRTPFKLDL